MNEVNRKFKMFLASRFKLIVGLTVIISIAFFIDLYLKGIDIFSIVVYFFITLGFILSIYPNRFSYFGAALMAFSTLQLMFFAVVIVFSDFNYILQLLISLSIAALFILALHAITIKRKLLLPKFESLFFAVLAYIITTLFLSAAFGGIALESNLFLFSVTTEHS
jgi:hypothetical protein